MFNRRSFIAAALCIGMVLPLAGCPGQNETAALIDIVGNSVASIASIQGDSALATKLQTDFAAASTAVKNWQTGTPSQDVVQALNLLIADLNLIPVDNTVKIYITLAVTTVESIIAIVSPSTTSAANAKSVKPMITAKQYKAEWNALVKAHPSKVPAIK